MNISDEQTTIIAKHMAHAALDWIDFETDGHSHTPECSNWGAFLDDATTLTAALGSTPEASDDERALLKHAIEFGPKWSETNETLGYVPPGAIGMYADAVLAAGFRLTSHPTPPEDVARDLRSFTAIDETVHAWQAWDGLWRTIPQNEAEQTRVLMTWRKRELVTALIAERQADLQRTAFGIQFLQSKCERLEAALAARTLPETEEWEYSVGFINHDGRTVESEKECRTDDRYEAEEDAEDMRATGTFSNAVAIRRPKNRGWLPIPEGSARADPS